jgi:hypothetical protein
MFRGTTVRTVVAILSAVLLALPFFAPTEHFASAHTVRQVEAKAQPGNTLSGKAVRDEAATFRNCDPAEDPTGPLRPRDRHRGIDFAPEAPDRPLPAQDRTDADRRLARVSLTASRPSTGHTPAALQVFRC